VEVKPIDGGSDADFPGMPNGHHTGRVIDFFHNYATMYDASRIGIAGQHDLGNDNTGITGTPCALHRSFLF
jgi:hypothetical protein